MLFISQYYRPETIGSGPFCADVAEAFVAQGRRVCLLTTRPHYPSGSVFPRYRNGELDTQRIRGVEVERVPTLVSSRGGAIQRFAGEGWFLLQGLLAIGATRIRRSDLVVSLCPSILSVLLGNVCRRRGARHIALVHDIQSGLAEGLGQVSGPVPRLLRYLERTVLNRCDLVVVLSENMRRQLLRCGATAPIEVLPIWADTENVQPRPMPPGPARTALYSGNFGRKQGLMQLVDLAEVLRARGSALRIVLRGQGNQADAINRAVADRKLNNVTFCDLLAPERLADGLAEGDIHLVPQNPVIADFAVPSKVYAIMAAGRPFVATAVRDSSLWQLQKDCGAFICVPPNAPQRLADAVLHLADDRDLRREMGERGHRYVKDHYSKDACLARLMAAIEGG
jgi:colanic acid biosynthesis glycosyl transferase WcaI